MSTEKPFVLCKGYPKDKVIRLYFSRSLSEMLGPDTHQHLCIGNDNSIIITHKKTEGSKIFHLFDLKTNTVSYSASLAKAITALPNCPNTEFKVLGWKKRDNAVILDPEKALFEEVM